MEDNKPWYASRAIWANLIGAIVAIAVSFNLISVDAGKVIIEQGVEFAVMVGMLLSNILGIYGRWSASTKISPISMPKVEPKG